MQRSEEDINLGASAGRSPPSPACSRLERLEQAGGQEGRRERNGKRARRKEENKAASGLLNLTRTHSDLALSLSLQPLGRPSPWGSESPSLCASGARPSAGPWVPAPKQHLLSCSPGGGQAGPPGGPGGQMPRRVLRPPLEPALSSGNFSSCHFYRQGSAQPPGWAPRTSQGRS